jgi:deoxyhypusine monooxygenase
MRPDLDSKIDKVGEILCEEGRPLKERFRALFTLRNIGGEQSIAWIEKCFQDPSALLKHELAYCLGQMGDPRALPLLNRILSDLDQHPMVRHEAGKEITSPHWY